MTEKAKMLNGELYDSSDKQLVDELIKAKKLCNQYNNLCIEDIEKGNEIIKKLFSKTGNEFMIMPNFYCDYGFNIEIGEKFYSNHNLVILDANKVTFGNNVQIGPNCGFYTSGHPIDKETRRKVEFAKPIVVGNDVWIGGNVCVMPGVTIGDARSGSQQSPTPSCLPPFSTPISPPKRNGWSATPQAIDPRCISLLHFQLFYAIMRQTKAGDYHHVRIS